MLTHQPPREVLEGVGVIIVGLFGWWAFPRGSPVLTGITEALNELGPLDVVPVETPNNFAQEPVLRPFV